ncbi:endonuclease [Bacillus sp. 4048]|uniref:AAA family ATPase n=1 Tax=Bacillus TaxID=1386 RepID=UPI0008FE3E88|nr:MULTISPECIES: AAA family ATPase [Bacillus]OJD46186.1 endonuclease [Bacillus sp. 4048]TCD27556.1 endonuclease [Bacillus wiedmannii]
MKLEWVRIKDFRSIEDTGRLYLDSKLTVLAGKNESGKSNILKALEAFSAFKFSQKDYPEGKLKKDSVPEVEISLKLSFKDIRGYIEKDNVVPRNHLDSNKEYYYTVKKNLVTNEQYTYGSIQNIFFTKREKEAMASFLKVLENRWKDDNLRRDPQSEENNLFEQLYNFWKNFRNYENPINWLKNYNLMVREYFDVNGLAKSQNEYGKVTILYRLGDEHGFTFSEIEVIQKLLNNFDDTMNRYEEFEKKLRIPKFKVLESFDQSLPDHVEIFSDEENIWSSYVEQALGVEQSNEDYNISDRELKRKTDKFSREITVLFQEVYTQNQIKLELDIGANNKLNFYVYDGENDIEFLPSQRSKGFQWFLSFFFAINALKKEGDIILIDEPGPYLHPKAQKDILKALEILTAGNQIIFTTHSPYLINPNNLERVRLVERNNKDCTVIENQIHASSIADQEVYTPIITAIGLDLSGSFGTFGEYNTIVEGISDYYYLECMKKYINNINQFGEMRFIPSIGASQIDKLASLLIGWGVNFKVLLDNDNAGKMEKKELEHKLLLSKEQLIFVSNEQGFAIEDLFSREDFLAYVVPDLQITEKEVHLKNSSLLKGKKALVAKMFKERLQKEDVKFDSKTIDNFTNLFHKLYGVNEARAEAVESV